MTTPFYLNNLYSGANAQNNPQVGTPEFTDMLSSIPSQYAAKADSNKTRFSGMMQGAGLDPNNFDYGQINTDIYDALGSTDPRALSLSNFDQGRDQRVMDSQAYINAAKKALSGGLSDDQMWADYDANKYKQSGFQNFMQSGIKAGLGAMIGAGVGDAAGLWNLGGGETAAMGLNQVGAMNPVAQAMTLAEPVALGSSAGVTPAMIGGSGISLGAPVALGSSAGITPTMIGGSGGAGSFLSGLSGVKDIAKAGASLYSAFKGKEGADATQSSLQTQMSTLNDMYKEGSPWANQLKEQLARKDAAAGRNSQYGSRLAQYQAMIADKAGQNAGVLGQLATQAGAANKDSNGYLNLLLNRAGDVSNATGLTKYLEDGVTDKVKSVWDSFFGP